MASHLPTFVNDAIVLLFCSALMFIVMYTAIAPWWKSSIGIALVTMDLGIAALLAPATIHDLIGDPGAHIGKTWYTLITLVIVMLAINWRTVILVRDQVRNLKEENDDHAVPRL